MGFNWAFKGLIRTEILKKEAEKAWIGLIRLRAWTGGGLL
jgi:hypothetical protein